MIHELVLRNLVEKHTKVMMERGPVEVENLKANPQGFKGREAEIWVYGMCVGMITVSVAADVTKYQGFYPSPKQEREIGLIVNEISLGPLKNTLLVTK